ncbi:cell envelope integrity protein CreD [Maricaulis sp.]|uniref:cell envelope integrity protein CreD n=1 Tax=Maricaulis sp. TaxID=1486257 RepID=UPI003A94BC83
MEIALKHRSLGLKLAVLGAIVLLLGIPLSLINFLSWEREGRADAASAEIAALFGGEQIIRGPFLVIPYSLTNRVWVQQDGERVSRDDVRHEHVFISFDQLDYAVEQTVVMRHRGIFDVPVYTAAIRVAGEIEIPEVAGQAPDGAELDYGAAEMVFAVSDLRGISDALDVQIAGRTTPVNFEPGTDFDQAGWRGVRAPLGPLVAGEALTFTAQWRMSGAAPLRFTASGRETTLSLQSNWPHPGFEGGFLPGEHEISDQGYTAQWTVPYLARGVAAVWGQRNVQLATLDGQAFGVRLVTPADGYQQVSRSLKYAMFFIGFLMVMFFLIETNSGQQIHPAQYVLAGTAQVIFYLLLLAMSEHVGVALAYGIAALATTGLTGLYAMTAFSSRALGAVTFAAMCVVYAMQYALILLEDYALLIGALLAFAGLAGTMLLTRHINWYASSPVGQTRMAPEQE